MFCFTQHASPKLRLLDSSSSEDEDSDYDEMFRSKPQFEGKKGEEVSILIYKLV